MECLMVRTTVQQEQRLAAEPVTSASSSEARDRQKYQRQAMSKVHLMVGQAEDSIALLRDSPL